MTIGMTIKPINIHVSESAQKRVQEMLDENKNSDDAKSHLRIYISGKNCDGFEYGVSFDDPGKTDVLTESKCPCPIIVDGPSKVFFYDCEIDWVDDERGQGFLVHNPQQKKFRGKFYKRQAWLDYFTDDEPSTTQSSN